jgi:transcriptional regulator with XRE-family HTH domain
MAIEFGRIGGGWAGGIVFNLWLRRQLRERKMSQRQLAARSGVDHSTISRLLGERHRPSLETATKLVAALRRIPDDLAAADYLEIPDEEVFPATRVELALRADNDLDEEDVRWLMQLYLGARRSNGESSRTPQPPPTPQVRALRRPSERAALERRARH